MRVGIVVNPIAGMGGRVGLKGTDGKVDAARDRGAEPRSPERAETAMAALAAAAPDATVLAGPGAMGAEEARAAGVEPIVVGDVDPARTREPAQTTAADTRAVVRAFLDAESDDSSSDAEVEPGVDLVLFVGGDGTAVDVAAALDDAGVDTPMLGVPAGVKVYSSVFAVTPREAGRIAAEFERVEEREVNDIDEDAFRGGEVHTELRAIRPVPVAEGVQASKQLGGGSVEGVVAGVLEEIRPGETYVFGPGSTVGAIESALGIDGSALGVDVWRATDGPSQEAAAEDVPTDTTPADATENATPDDGPTHTTPAEATENATPADATTDTAPNDPTDSAAAAAGTPAGELLVRDGSADEVRAATADADDVVIVVSPIGGQGFVLGRGNQQIAPDVVRGADLEVVASRSKLDGLGSLRVDTDDEALDEQLRGWTKARVGRYEHRMLPVE